MSPDLPLFATSLPSDGMEDMFCISGLTPRIRGIQMLMHAETGGIVDFPEVQYRKVHAYRITPRIHQPPPDRRLLAKFGKWLGGGGKLREGLIAIDGERVPFEPFQAEVVPKLATVLSRRYRLYEYGGPKRPSTELRR
jgi:sphingosine kinase